MSDQRAVFARIIKTMSDQKAVFTSSLGAVYNKSLDCLIVGEEFRILKSTDEVKTEYGTEDVYFAISQAVVNNAQFLSGNAYFRCTSECPDLEYEEI